MARRGHQHQRIAPQAAAAQARALDLPLHYPQTALSRQQATFDAFRVVDHQPQLYPRNSLVKASQDGWQRVPAYGPRGPQPQPAGRPAGPFRHLGLQVR